MTECGAKADALWRDASAIKVSSTHSALRRKDTNVLRLSHPTDYAGEAPITVKSYGIGHKKHKKRPYLVVRSLTFLTMLVLPIGTGPCKQFLSSLRKAPVSKTYNEKPYECIIAQHSQVFN